MPITYTVAEKSQTAIDPHFGGGVRYAFTLASKYAFMPDRNDAYCSKLIVDKESFDGLDIGDTLTLGFFVAETSASNV